MNRSSIDPVAPSDHRSRRSCSSSSTFLRANTNCASGGPSVRFGASLPKPSSVFWGAACRKAVSRESGATRAVRNISSRFPASNAGSVPRARPSAPCCGQNSSGSTWSARCRTGTSCSPFRRRSARRSGIAAPSSRNSPCAPGTPSPRTSAPTLLRTDDARRRVSHAGARDSKDPRPRWPARRSPDTPRQGATSSFDRKNPPRMAAC